MLSAGLRGWSLRTEVHNITQTHIIIIMGILATAPAFLTDVTAAITEGKGTLETVFGLGAAILGVVLAWKFVNRGAAKI